MQTAYYYSSDLALSPRERERERRARACTHTHPHTGGTVWGKRSEERGKQAGYTDNGSIMFLEMERQERCDFQHSSKGQEKVQIIKREEDIIF